MIKRLGRRTEGACVFPSPSEIPYGGFSPVRLQGQPVRQDLSDERASQSRLPTYARSFICLSPPFAHAPIPASGELRVPPARPLHAPLCTRHLPRYPRGPWLRRQLCCLAPSALTTTPSVSLTGTRRFLGTAGYTSRLRCAGAPRRPARPSLLSLPCCPHVPSTIRRWVRDAVPLLVRAAIPGFLGCKTSRHPRPPSLPAILDGKSISALHRSR